MSEAQTVLKLIGQKSKVQIVSGYYRGLDGLRASVDFADGRVPAYFTSDWRPEVNEAVWVEVVDGVAYMRGPTIPKPPNGEVVSVTGGVAVVSTDVGQVTATFDPGRTYSTGDRVKLAWHGGCWILGIRSDVPPEPDVPAPPGGGGGKQTRTFTAIGSGTYGNSLGWWTNDLRCSVRNECAWFYGNKIRDTIPDTARILSAEIYLPQVANLGAAPFGRHDSPTQPVGAVTFHNAAELPRRTGWVPIPTALLEHLKANPGGLGFAGGGNSRWDGTQKDAQSGAVRVTYQ